MGSEQTEPGAAVDAVALQEGRGSYRSETIKESEGLSDRALVEFRCIRNAAYHEDREMHYARIHRFLMFIVVAVGTASIGASLVKENKYATIGTAIAVLAGLFDLLWNIDGMARLHSKSQTPVLRSASPLGSKRIARWHSSRVCQNYR